MGIEPTIQAWEAYVLPLYYARKKGKISESLILVWLYN